jgi:hypothetical protein
MRAGTAKWTIGIAGLLVAVGSCGGIKSPPDQDPAPGAEGPVGQISAGLHLGQSRHDVRSVRFDIVPAAGNCDARPLASVTRGFEPGALPGAMSPAGAGEHGFADGLFVLPVGEYRACATPLKADAAPSMECTRADTVITVTLGRIVAVILVSQCRGAGSGGVDVVTALNDPPTITALAITPSKFITTCQSATVTAMATDPDRDALTYEWAIASGTGGTLASAGNSATFSSMTAGDFTISLTVSDVHAAKASITFPVHVAAADCTPPPTAAPEAVQAIIAARCTPCHTADPTRGGLRMDNAELTFRNLVGVPVGAAACNTRVRAIPGNGAGSYIVAKLKGEVGICGQRMPRILNPDGTIGPPAPPLPDAEIATIENWINGLPH